MKEAISFVITNYNYGNYISQALESVAFLNGDFDKEVFIVDDGSTDASEIYLSEIAELYRGCFSNLTIIFNNENNGKIYCLNKVIPLISSRLTVILDADDYLHANFLLQTFHAYQEQKDSNPSIAFIYTNCSLVNSVGEIIGYGKSTSFDKSLIEKYSYIPDNALTETKVLMEIFPMNQTVRTATKHYKWKLICRNLWEGFHLASPLFFYRMHDKNLSNIGNKILSTDTNSSKENLLSGYWPTHENV